MRRMLCGKVSGGQLGVVKTEGSREVVEAEDPGKEV